MAPSLQITNAVFERLGWSFRDKLINDLEIDSDQDFLFLLSMDPDEELPNFLKADAPSVSAIQCIQMSKLARWYQRNRSTSDDDDLTWLRRLSSSEVARCGKRSSVTDAANVPATSGRPRRLGIMEPDHDDDSSEECVNHEYSNSNGTSDALLFDNRNGMVVQNGMSDEEQILLGVAAIGGLCLAGAAVCGNPHARAIARKFFD
eukprot:CAMPEP_0119556456 /NCGR_PEP_ID=MMETSP1352-20130426/8406_1 /TAXON_ID=265584 /ORGANISM="Stauroneis constricta, Strain CCMP1120" /LENGTH=203 /DNA_ID=CAMNT_0007603419 /DNA_START=81 /DNA_END=692 /DNA_ORIENTATION=+